jgi:hypothetical protein
MAPVGGGESDWRHRAGARLGRPTGSGTGPGGEAGRHLWLRRCCGPGCATASLRRRSAPRQLGHDRTQERGRRFWAAQADWRAAWWLWGAVHVMFLLGVCNRLSVILDWVWSYFTFDVGVRLITDEGTRRLSPSHSGAH